MALIEHLEKLRHFHKISLYRSINEASKNLGLSQAGLSKSLILLEEVLNCKLFIRSREGLTLTKEGAEVLQVTKRIIHEACELENRLCSLKASTAPNFIKFGMYDSIAVYFGIEMQRYLHEIYNNVNLSIVTDNSSNLLNKILEDDLDLAIGVNFKSLESENLVFFPLFDDFYSFYESSQEAGVPSNSIIIYENATDEKGRSIKDLIKTEFKSKTVHIVQNFETLKQLTIQGLGVGVLPTKVASPILKQELIRPYNKIVMKAQFGQHQIGILVRKKLLQKYEDFVKDIIRLGQRWVKS